MAKGTKATKNVKAKVMSDIRALRERSPSPSEDGENHNDPPAHVGGIVRRMIPLSAPSISSENSHKAHHYSEEEWEKVQAFSSITYLPLHTRVFQKWLEDNWIKREWDHWVMMGLIGFFVGMLGSTLKLVIEKIVESKFHHITILLKKEAFGLMWFLAIAMSMSLALASAVVVVYGEPAAAGSGIPDIMAYLNGISIRKIFGSKALVVKFFSCVFAVSAGLYGGQEGPMIHMGSAIGKILSQGVSFSGKYSKIPDFILFKRLRNMYDRRNFISAGAAAGVASAFTAPVGGLLFVLEEISSFWTHKLAWQIFFCCGVASFTTQAFTSLYRTGSLGSFSRAAFNIDQAINSQLTMFLPTVGVGIMGGLFAALFTWANLNICQWRNRNIVPRPWARIAEPAVVAFLTTTLAVLIPYLFECMPTRCKKDPSLPGCTPRYASSDVPEEGLMQYTCQAEGMYNPAATLFFTTGDRTIEHLLSRNTHYMFDYGSLITLFVVYFSLCCYTMGMAPALGSMVPALLIGSVLGRIAGLGVTDIVGIHEGEELTWVDPGGFALIGAAAFFGGLTRLTFTLAVVMIELTDETHFLLPIMTAVMVGKWTADLLIDSLYHKLIDLKCFPFLSDEPHVEECLDLYTVEDVMGRDVVTIPEIGSVALMAHILASCNHRALPVVEVTENGNEVFKGIILRSHVFSILAKESLFLEEDNPVVVSKSPSFSMGEGEEGVTNLHMEALGIAELVNLDDKMPVTLLAKTEGERKAMLGRLQAAEYHRRFVTLAPYIDQSSYRIAPTFSLERGFNLFRTMGLSHITVVDQNNEVVGIVSRKDLTNMNIYRKLEEIQERTDEGRSNEPDRSKVEYHDSTSGIIFHDYNDSPAPPRVRQTRLRSVRDPEVQESHSKAIAAAGLDQGMLI